MTFRSSEEGFQNALKLFYQASKRVPAYRDFLAKAQVKPELIKTAADFASVPITNKTNYISQYPLDQLCLDGDLASMVQIPMSSGSSGNAFFWPTSKEQDRISGEIFRRVFENIFLTLQTKTLFVSSFGMGSWKAGLEFYAAARWAIAHGSLLTIITPGLDMNETVKQIDRLAQYYDQVILAGYPPFVRDIINCGTRQGIVWRNYNLKLLTAGEPYSEAWRDHALRSIGQKSHLSAINLYGMAEVGALGHETPLSIQVRRKLQNNQTHPTSWVDNVRMTSLYQYDPALRYLEVDHGGMLILTTSSGLPLVRYDTRDQGAILSYDQALNITKTDDKSEREKWHLPFVALFGRLDIAAQFYAVNIYPENIKALVEDESVAARLTGIFVMEVKSRTNDDPYLELSLELAPNATNDANFRKQLQLLAVQRLRIVNSEYNKLYGAIGNKAAPKIKLVKNGTIDYVPGKKHKWVKRA